MCYRTTLGWHEIHWLKKLAVMRWDIQRFGCIHMYM